MASNVASRLRLSKAPNPSIDTSDCKSASGISVATLSTIEGFGLLSDKAIHVFEKLSLRAVENAAIRRRIKILEAYLPVKGPESEDNIPLYADVLELCRPDHYTPAIRRHALRLVLLQIASGDITQLVRVLSKGPHFEIRLFLTELMACLPEIWVRTKRTELHFAMQDVYLESTSRFSGHAAAPFINFIRQLSETTTTGAQAALEAGFMDMFLCMCISDFYVPSPAPKRKLRQSTEREKRAALLRDCSLCLRALAAEPDNFALMVNHWHFVNILAPASHREDLVNTASMPLGSLSPSHPSLYMITTLIMHKLTCIETFLEDMHITRSNYAGEDLVEFARRGGYSSSIRDRALMVLLKYTLQHSRLRGRRNHVLSDLCKSTYSDVLNMFSRLITLLLSDPFGSHTSASESAFGGSLEILVPRFPDFASYAAQRSLHLRRALAEADIQLLLPHCHKGFIDPDEWWYILLITKPCLPVLRVDKTVSSLDREASAVEQAEAEAKVLANSFKKLTSAVAIRDGVKAFRSTSRFSLRLSSISWGH